MLIRQSHDGGWYPALEAVATIFVLPKNLLWVSTCDFEGILEKGYSYGNENTIASFRAFVISSITNPNCGAVMKAKLHKTRVLTPTMQANDSGQEPTKSMPLNFKVSSEFRREFKTYAAQHNKKLNQLLYESFKALKASHAE